MPLFKKVAVVGVGMIGGSIAANLKSKALAKEVVGVSKHKTTLIAAKKLKIIDNGSLDLDILKDADLVILAMPVKTIIEKASAISKIIKKDCIVTDVGSTKIEISSKLSKIFPNYIGAHPLAGSEKRGILNADIGIFKNSLCILTSEKKTNRKALLKIKLLWKKLGAKVIILSADKHDQILSFVSHLPHLIAFALINSIPQGHLKYGSTGLKDTTRIASSEAQIWSDIFLSNRVKILQAIKAFELNLSKLKSALNKNQSKKILFLLRKAKKSRERLQS